MAGRSRCAIGPSMHGVALTRLGRQPSKKSLPRRTWIERDGQPFAATRDTRSGFNIALCACSVSTTKLAGGKRCDNCDWQWGIASSSKNHPAKLCCDSKATHSCSAMYTSDLQPRHHQNTTSVGTGAYLLLPSSFHSARVCFFGAGCVHCQWAFRLICF